jgi:hypothetical protein
MQCESCALHTSHTARRSSYELGLVDGLTARDRRGNKRAVRLLVKAMMFNILVTINRCRPRAFAIGDRLGSRDWRPLRGPRTSSSATGKPFPC